MIGKQSSISFFAPVGDITQPQIPKAFASLNGATGACETLNSRSPRALGMAKIVAGRLRRLAVAKAQIALG